MVGAYLEVVALFGAIFLAFSALSIHRRALRTRAFARSAWVASRRNNERAERFFRSARMERQRAETIHARCEPKRPQMLYVQRGGLA